MPIRATVLIAIVLTACGDVPGDYQKLRGAEERLRKDPHDSQTLDFILKKLHDSRSITRNNAAAFLRLLAGDPKVRAVIAPRAVPALIEVARRHGDVESEGIAALGEFRELGAPAIPTLITRVQENDYRSGDAAEALGKIGLAAKSSIPHLRVLLHRSKDRRIVVQTAIAIRTLVPDDRESIDTLIGFLHSPDREVRSDGIFALSELGPLADSAVPALEAYDIDDLRGYAQSTAASIKEESKEAVWKK